jgi:hypothetical protein
LTYTRSDGRGALLASSLLYKEAEERFEEVAKMMKKMKKAKETRLGIPCRSCVHAENGRAEIPKICIRDYECWHCAFDQWIEELEERQVLPGLSAVERNLVARAA